MIIAKFSNAYVDSEIIEIRPKIFALSIKDDYQRTMLFCRYQEFYESPLEGIRGKFFTWEKYMMLYKNKYKKNTFTYPDDWAGFNIPSEVLKEAIQVFKDDIGPYDYFMNEIFEYCDQYSSNGGPKTKWYLIGANGFKSKTMNHEIAHGLYYTDQQYKENCDNLVSEIKPQHYKKLTNKLVKMGYIDDKKIIDDEIQAFMSTGLYNGLETKELRKYEKGFVDNFKKFSK